MRTVLFFAFCFLGVPVFCQNADSLVAVQEVDSLVKLSGTFLSKGQFDDAQAVNAVAEKIVLDKLGHDSPAYRNCCLNRGRIHYYKLEYLEAEKWYLKATEIHEKKYGRQNRDYGVNMYNLALLYQEMSDFERSKRHYTEALDIFEKTIGKEHAINITCLRNYAGLLNLMSDYGNAEQVLLDAKLLLEKTKGKEHVDYALLLHTLGGVYLNMGAYEKAEPIYLESIALKKKVMGENHVQYLHGLNALASLYSDIGILEKAERYVREAILIWGDSEALGHAASLELLGSIHDAKNQHKEALQIYQQAERLLAKNPGKEDRNYGIILHSLATVHKALGNFEQSELLFLQAMEIFGRKSGNESLEYLSSLSNLAGLYTQMARPHEAEASFREVFMSWQKNQSKEHLSYLVCLTGLSRLYETQGRFSESSPLLTELCSRIRSQMLLATSYLSEQEFAKHITTFQYHTNNLFSYLLSRPTNSSQSGELKRLALDHALFYKGFLLFAANRQKMLINSSPETETLHKHIESYRRRLAAEYAKPIAERKGVGDLEEKANTAEKELARTVAGYAEAIRQVKWQEVQAGLKPDEAAIEFVHFQVIFPKNTDSTMYAALVLRPGDVQPHFIPLFEQKSLDSLLQTQGERRADYVNQLYTFADRSAKPLNKPQKTLYELLWKPLEKELSSVKTIYFSPSGLLHRLNLAAIPIGLDSVLGDRHPLVELGSTRQLVVPNQVKPAANDAVLFGGISYDSDSTALSQANTALDSIAIASRGELSFSYTDSTLRVSTWGDLHYTGKEVESLGGILKSAGIQPQTRRGYAATEEAFKSIGAGGVTSPRVLHLATHGYFFPDPAADRQPPTLDREPTFKLSDHPMIRSGLILAGGNHAWATGKPLREDMEDGILTAYEISQMNLSNTELVVLSACETGLGDISGNEGVYGLQRAFKIAGAKYLIMSLWQVPDQETSVFMTAFYKHWLEGKMSIPDAFRTTQQEMRERFINPYQWAGFVLVE